MGWLTEERRKDTPPPLTEPVVTGSSPPASDTGHRLSADDYDELLALLQRLTGSRNKIQDAMGFCLDNADAAEEVSERTRPTTTFRRPSVCVYPRVA